MRTGRNVAASPQCQIGLSPCSCRPAIIGAGTHSSDDDDTDSLRSSQRVVAACIECGLELESEDDAQVFSCCSSSRHLQCLAPFVVAVDQEVLCRDCPRHSADHVSADWFQRLCLIHGVGWPCNPQLPDCTVCTEAMAVENSIQVPCCGQFVHTVCLARSFSSRGVDCPFCNQSLADFARSSSFLASSLFHGCMVDLDRAPSNQAIDSLIVPDDFVFKENDISRSKNHK